MDPKEARRRLASRTPKEIDTKLMEFDGLRARAEQQLKTALVMYERDPGAYAEMVSNARAGVADVYRKVAMLEREYDRRPWARFFEVNNINGHIHSSMDCPTTYVTTSWSRVPELSDRTEQEAVKLKGPWLCSVCFPSAPAEWTMGDDGLTDEHCPGSNGDPVKGSIMDKTRYYNGGFYADCPHCDRKAAIGQALRLKAGRKLPKHKPSSKASKAKRDVNPLDVPLRPVSEFGKGDKFIEDGVLYTVDDNVKVPGIDMWCLRAHTKLGDDGRAFFDKKLRSDRKFFKVEDE